MIHGDGGRQGQGGAMGLERVIVAISLDVGDMHRGPTTVDVTLYFRGTQTKRPLKVRTTSPMICAFVHCCSLSSPRIPRISMSMSMRHYFVNFL